MTPERPCILIYNPISGHGHLDSWNALFVGFLLERGYRVLALTPDRTALESRLAKRGMASHTNLHIFSLHRLSYAIPWKVKFRRLWQWWLAYAQIYTNKRPESRISSCMPLGTRTKKRIFHLIVPPLFVASRAVYSTICRLTNGQEFSDHVQDSYETRYLDPVDMALRINAALKQSSWKPVCVFNMYLDMYMSRDKRWQQFDKVFSLPWGGIRFVPPNPASKGGYFALKTLRGLCFLDESICEKYRAIMPDKYFQHLPDITNVDVPEHSSPLVDNIRGQAAGRNIVFLGGSIGGQKNIARWCELIKLADPAKWFFVQVGEIHTGTFLPEDAKAYQRLVDSLPENVLLHTEYLPDEREFNAVIQAADVIFAAYRDFRISSNMLGKAAYFEKPILVSVGYLMESLVRKYQIGIAVSEHDCRAMLEALERLVSCPIPAVNYEGYRRDFQADILAGNLSAFLQNISEPESYWDGHAVNVEHPVSIGKEAC